MAKSKSRSITQEVGYHDLLRDLRHQGCPVCRGASRSAWRYIDAILWESVNDPGIRRRLRAAHGFCREHAMMSIDVARQQANALGVAIMYEDFLRHVRDDVHAARARPGRKAEIAAPHEPCPACEIAAGKEFSYLRILGKAAPDSEAGELARRPGRWICYPHARRGIRVATAPDEQQRLADLYLQGDDEVRRHLKEFVRKHDYRYQDEGMSRDQSASWRRAVYGLVGYPHPRKPLDDDHRTD